MHSDTSLPVLAVVGITVASVLGLQLVLVALGYLLWKTSRNAGRSSSPKGARSGASPAALEAAKSPASGRGSFLARWIGANAEGQVVYSPLRSRSREAEGEPTRGVHGAASPSGIPRPPGQLQPMPAPVPRLTAQPCRPPLPPPQPPRPPSRLAFYAPARMFPSSDPVRPSLTPANTYSRRRPRLSPSASPRPASARPADALRPSCAASSAAACPPASPHPCRWARRQAEETRPASRGRSGCGPVEQGRARARAVSSMPTRPCRRNSRFGSVCPAASVRASSHEASGGRSRAVLRRGRSPRGSRVCRTQRSSRAVAGPASERRASVKEDDGADLWSSCERRLIHLHRLVAKARLAAGSADLGTRVLSSFSCSFSTPLILDQAHTNNPQSCHNGRQAHRLALDDGLRQRPRAGPADTPRRRDCAREGRGCRLLPVPREERAHHARLGRRGLAQPHDACRRSPQCPGRLLIAPTLGLVRGYGVTRGRGRRSPEGGWPGRVSLLLFDSACGCTLQLSPIR
ncbi:hypothetical protein DMC30DRAFT_449271, partial [Rhodotorula diobovata]